ncbi:hypothetical protein C0585_05230 [Candidatus Woesearchaeota archaeon]|nr:MAG: hypothetical protein C0585_05230 [Candidatus Woesearchaeota archaeon]
MNVIKEFKITKEYFKKISNIDVILSNKNISNIIPVYLSKKYHFKIAKVLNKNILFAFRKCNINSITPKKIEKDFINIIKLTKLQPVFVDEHVNSYLRNRLIKKNIPFVIPNNQMYLPFFMIDLKEYFPTEKNEIEKFSPSTQLYLFKYLLGDNQLLNLNQTELSEKFECSKMTIVRIFKELENFDFCEVAKKGKEKYISFNIDRKEIFEKTKDYFINPIIKKYYYDFLPKNIDVIKSSENALEKFTDIIGNNFKTYTILDQKIAKNMKKSLPTGYGNVIIEKWKYNPTLLTNDKYIDKLSLYCIYKDSNDERIKIELEKLIKDLFNDSRT